MDIAVGIGTVLAIFFIGRVCMLRRKRRQKEEADMKIARIAAETP